MQEIAWFEDLTRADEAVAGGKGANLGELAHLGVRVPRGFVVTADAYRELLRATGVDRALSDLLTGLDASDASQLNLAAERAQKLLLGMDWPEGLQHTILTAYHRLAGDDGATFVAVRSSGVAEDSKTASFTGMNRSFLNVYGDSELLMRIKDCWASLYGARSIDYRLEQHLAGEPSIAVVVQRMVESDKSGVLFSVNPTTEKPHEIVVDAAFGLGEVVVLGEVTPDHLVVDKVTGKVIERQIGFKDFKLVRGEQGETERVPLEDAEAERPVLDREDIKQLVALAIQLEDHYGAPQEFEWAIQGKDLYLVQTCPITTLKQPKPSPQRALVRGLGASPGLAVGRVRILHSLSDASRLADGEILVTHATSPDWLPLMKRASATVTDTGGLTSHAAIVSREMGLPCIVGTRNATELLHDGDLVTVDASHGVVLRGRVTDGTSRRAPAKRVEPAPEATGTKLYVSLADPEEAERVAQLAVDGVGLLRAEFLLLNLLEREHPRAFIDRLGEEAFISRLADGLRTFARAFKPRPVVYRASDFRSNEYRGLTGGEAYEPREENPMIGYRGCFRYITEPDMFDLELRAIARVRREGYENLHLMIPFVRTRWEAEACMELVDESPLGSARHFERWLMAEVPSVVHYLPDYRKLGFTGLSIGSNDLTQLVLGVDRDSERCQDLYDERDPAVLATIQAILRVASKLGMTTSICGQGPSVYPEYAERLVSWGIHSVSVTPDAIEPTRRHVASAERKLMLDQALRKKP